MGLLVSLWASLWASTVIKAEGTLTADETTGPVTARAEDSGFVDRFKSLGSDNWHVADYDFSHPAFDTDWRKSQAVFDDGLTLHLSPQAPSAPAGNRFIGASVRRHDPSHYGRYEVALQAARGEGLIVGFFTYTGPHYGTTHDEIDIEFLGQDTTKLHAAWFVDGALREKFIDLGFDAADRVHSYAFEWAPDAIRWYADQQLIFQHHVTDGPVPSLPGRLFANIWAADRSIASWSGLADSDLSTTARIKCMAFRPAQTAGKNSCVSPAHNTGDMQDHFVSLADPEKGGAATGKP